MKIYFYDGSVLTCNKIEFGIDGLIVDEYRLVVPEEIRMILSD